MSRKYPFPPSLFAIPGESIYFAIKALSIYNNHYCIDIQAGLAILRTAVNRIQVFKSVRVSFTSYTMRGNIFMASNSNVYSVWLNYLKSTIWANIFQMNHQTTLFL